MRKEFGISPDDFVFMSTGQLSKRKNHEVVIKALSLCHFSKVKYLLVGFGEEEEWLKGLAKRLGVEDKVIFAGYRRDVKNLLSIVNAYVFPSIQEGLPVSLMEAMAAGLPIVCSKIRGNIDLIEEEKGGYLVDPHDERAFMSRMEDIMKKDCTEMTKFNLDKMKQFDSNSINRLMKKIYESCTDMER